MALNIKNTEVVRLAGELAAMNGETKTEAIRIALKERKQRLAFQVLHQDKRAQLKQFLEQEVWTQVPEDELGRVMTRDETDDLLGFGPEGV